jgi:hypothetical protein
VSVDLFAGPDESALQKMRAFVAGIGANAGAYGAGPSDVDTMTGVVDEFESALTIAKAPPTRTKLTVAAKVIARGQAASVCRRYAILIKYNNAISDVDTLAIGVEPVNNNREPVYCPQSTPMLSIAGSAPGSMTMRYCDANTPDSGKKPAGAFQLELYLAVAPEPIENPETAVKYRAFTRNPIYVVWNEADDKKTATIWGRWIGRRGDTGPWSVPISTTIAA